MPKYKKIPWLGSDFLPFYHNLNFVKGIISLHSLLVSRDKSELSIKNYVDEHKKNYPKVNVADFENKILAISTSFKKVFRSYTMVCFACPTFVKSPPK